MFSVWRHESISGDEAAKRLNAPPPIGDTLADGRILLSKTVDMRGNVDLEYGFPPPPDFTKAKASIKRRWAAYQP